QVGARGIAAAQDVLPQPPGERVDDRVPRDRAGHGTSQVAERKGRVAQWISHSPKTLTSGQGGRQPANGTSPRERGSCRTAGSGSFSRAWKAVIRSSRSSSGIGSTYFSHRSGKSSDAPSW